MSKQKEINPEFRIWLIEECLAGRMRGREAARRAGVSSTAMRKWISLYKMDRPAAFASSNAKRTYSEEIKKKVVKDYLNGKGSFQTAIRFSRCGAGFGNKKSPHNNLTLTIPSGIALVRVCYVAIRKSKTCSGSFGSRAGTLSKYVILNCWDRLPQKSSHVNVNLSGQGPSILLRKTVLSLKSPTGAFIAPLRCANANF